MKSKLHDRLNVIIEKYEHEYDAIEMQEEYMPLNDRFVPFRKELLEKPKYTKSKTYKLQFTPSMDRHE